MLVIFVDAFKHRGAVAISPCVHSGHYDIALHNMEGRVLKTVECVPADALVENIDLLVEVTENYFDDIDRWLEITSSNEKQMQQIGRMMKRRPDLNAVLRMKIEFPH